MGTKRPKKYRKAEVTVKRYARSENGLKKSFRGSGVEDGGRRATMVRLAKTSKPKITNAQTRLGKLAIAISGIKTLVTGACNLHGPGKADFRDQAIEHDREEDAA